MFGAVNGLVRLAVLGVGAVIGTAGCAWLVGAAITVAQTPAWGGDSTTSKLPAVAVPRDVPSGTPLSTPDPTVAPTGAPTAAAALPSDLPSTLPSTHSWVPASGDTGAGSTTTAPTGPPVSAAVGAVPRQTPGGVLGGTSDLTDQEIARMLGSDAGSGTSPSSSSVPLPSASPLAG
ncbi:hypothetical protein SAMN06264364_10676 [Quadrisphaera granulorum]|uniref:Uncharacterized protein n=1 Tax=Quadrisphaera granulorum TaxID=317664 RepID=A0A316AAC7_9ACTN|nr:hypothetical protein [Quadrisphaera granulorum]PWJ54633.1 hypothetical protein BXY45_10676 [Quadrisphaera granulorum]SZE95995.1 hypothetical protein SAMN06264364_10676 [Quadrisphaera granulorum]